MISMDDFVAAKLLLDRDIIGAEALRSALRARARPEAPDTKLIDELQAARLLSSEYRDRAAEYVWSYGFNKLEAIYLELLRQRQALTPDLLVDAQRSQQEAQGSDPKRLGELLLERRAITPEQDEFLLKQAYYSIKSTAESIIADNCRRDFVPLCGPILAGKRSPSGRLSMSELKISQLAPSKQELASVLEQSARTNCEELTALPIPNLQPPPAPVKTPTLPAPPTPDPAEELQPVPNRPASTALAPRQKQLATPKASLRTPAKRDWEIAPGGKLGAYTVVKKLGEGGMGVVYLVRDDEGQQAALKLTKPVQSSAAKEVEGRFKREILATSFFHHENVIQIFDAGQIGSSHFMAMEFLEGLELRALLKQEGRLSLGRAVRLMRQAFDALAAMHSARIVHRDLKPENFMIVMREDREFLKIMDFGIARILDQQEEFSEQIFQTVAGKFSGSPKYTSPEACMEPEVDARADLYTMGVILFELVTGSLPFYAPTSLKYLQQHLYTAPKSIAEVAEDLPHPESLQRLISRLLVKDRDERIQTASEVVAFIDGILLPDITELEGSPERSPDQEKEPGGSMESGLTPLAQKSGCLGFLGKILQALATPPKG